MSQMPSAAEILRIQQDLEAAVLPDTLYLLARTIARTSQGGTRETWGTAGTVIGRIDAYSSKGLSSFKGDEMVAGGAVQSFSRSMLTIPAGADLTVAQRVQSGTVLYNIVAVDIGKSWAMETRAIIEKVLNNNG